MMTLNRIIELKCPRCGGPLPVVGEGLVNCRYCGARCLLEGGILQTPKEEMTEVGTQIGDIEPLGVILEKDGKGVWVAPGEPSVDMYDYVHYSDIEALQSHVKEQVMAYLGSIQKREQQICGTLSVKEKTKEIERQKDALEKELAQVRQTAEEGLTEVFMPREEPLGMGDCAYYLVILSLMSYYCLTLIWPTEMSVSWAIIMFLTAMLMIAVSVIEQYTSLKESKEEVEDKDFVLVQ